MDELEKLNLQLVSEANKILYDYGLLEILKRYGRPIVQGSYALNLMTWRDLDIYLESDEMNVARFFNLGAEIVTRFNPRRMSYRNEIVGESPELPKGLYWGIYAMLTFPAEWKIDIWTMDSNQTRAYLKRFEDLKREITEENRPAILEIKNKFCTHPEHRKGFMSLDIYKAVIEENVKSVEEFAKWLRKNKGIE